MIDCPFIPSNSNRLLQRHRPKPLVRSDPADRIKGTKRLRPGLNLGQTLWRNTETANFNLHNNASTVVTNPAHSALSP